MWNATSATARAASSSLLTPLNAMTTNSANAMTPAILSRSPKPASRRRGACGPLPGPTTRTSEGSTSMRFTPLEG
jgi:hypothetical protein